MIVYVICQNDFPIRVVDEHVAALQFIDRQPKVDLNGRPIYWRYYQFLLNKLEDR